MTHADAEAVQSYMYIGNYIVIQLNFFYHYMVTQCLINKESTCVDYYLTN